MTGGWLVIAAIAPPIVQAYTSRLSIALDVQPGETYATFLRRAEAVAGAAVQRSFDRDILLSEVSVVVVGQKSGASAQVLSLQANRTQWRSRPDPRRWATYYRSAASLLRFGEATAGTQSPSAPVVTEQIAAPPQSPTQSVAGPVPSAPVKPSPAASPAPLPFPSPDSLPQPPIRIRPGTTPLPPSR